MNIPGVHVNPMKTVHVMGKGVLKKEHLGAEEMNAIIRDMYEEGQVKHGIFGDPSATISVTGLRGRDHPGEILHILPRVTHLDRKPVWGRARENAYVLEREEMFGENAGENLETAFHRSALGHEEVVDHFHHFLKEKTGKDIGEDHAIEFLNTLIDHAQEKHYMENIPGHGGAAGHTIH